ncbi:MAG: hypothetical protein R3B90_13060 [Planctomycetaceae bacterium]
MKSRRLHRRQTARPPRSGLPLELVLALPLLMLVTALMIVMGSAGAWKVRTLANSRQAILRGISPRSTDADPNPRNFWPNNTAMRYSGGGGASPFEEDPYLDHTVVRGPSVSDPETGNSLQVKIETMDMRDGLNHGFASINHDPPLAGGLGVRNNFARSTPMFVGLMWRWEDMANWSPDSRRIPRVYNFDMSLWDPQSASRTLQARDAIQQNPHRPDLLCSTATGNWAIGTDTTSTSTLAPFVCDNDVPTLIERVQQPMIDSIERVPRRMAETFKRMYEEQLEQLEAMTPRPPNYQQLRAELEEKIRQLERFLDTL